MSALTFIISLGINHLNTFDCE